MITSYIFPVIRYEIAVMYSLGGYFQDVDTLLPAVYVCIFGLNLIIMRKSWH